MISKPKLTASAAALLTLASVSLLRAQDITSKDLLDGLANPSRWLTHSGDYTGARFSPLAQITPANVGQLAPQWTFQTGVVNKFEATPIVVDGVMYVTGPLNHAWAIDARTGRQIWHYQRQLPQGLKVCCGMVNRGFAVYGDRLFMGTLDAHFVALEMKTGKVIYDIEMAPAKDGFASTGAPLVVNGKVIAGIAGGEFANRGFLDAYNPATGERLWRFYTIPAPGDPGSDSWQGEIWQRGGGPTWLTGTYDAETGLLYWPTGNPFPDTDGSERAGDNLYTNSDVALDPKTGELRWYFQFTPHDLHDWDAVQPPVLVNATFNGRARKLLLHANRNGYFYVLDRTNGELLLSKPFVKKLTWSDAIDAAGRPKVTSNNETTPGGVKTCPAVRGATNWYSTAFNPQTKLYYVMVVEDCSTYRQAKQGGFGFLDDPRDPAMKYLRALNIETGKIAWEVPQVGPVEHNYSGVLATSSGLVFYGESSGAFAAVDAKNGKTLWHFGTGGIFKASPMTYMVGGRQYVAIASGANIIAFALPESKGK